MCSAASACPHVVAFNKRRRRERRVCGALLLRMPRSGKIRTMRIVSLLPSATEIVCSLGLGEQLVGVTHECDYPAFVRDLPKVTRTLIRTAASSGEIDRLVREQLATSRALYTLDAALLEELRPDLIVTQALCDVCAVAEEEVRAAACRLPGAPRVINLEPQRLADVFAAIRQVAQAADVERHGDEVVQELTARVEAVVSRTAALERRPRVALLEWLDPPFSSGHWNPELVRLAGGVEGLGREGQPSRTLRWDEIAAWAPEVVLIACCGFSIERTRQDLPALGEIPEWRALPAVAAGRVYVADGSQYFNRPGPRLVDSLEILAHAISPQTHPLPSHLRAAVEAARDASASRRDAP
jgi:iron complex transport system substrate-binding protein